MDAEERIRELQHRLKQQERLHEANIKGLCADLETAYVENDKMAQRIGELEDVVDVQQERLESAEKHLSTAKSKCKVFACECTEKEEQIEKLGGFCQTAKKKLLYTEDRFQVAPEEIEHLPMQILG